MKRTLLSAIGCLLFAIGSQAQPGGGFGGFGGFQQQAKLETSQEWKDVNYSKSTIENKTIGELHKNLVSIST